MNSTRILSAATALFATAALVAGTVAPAAAKPNDPPKTTQEDKEAKDMQKRYCIQGPTTGTIMPKRICHTRAEWIAKEGFDPVKKN